MANITPNPVYPVNAPFNTTPPYSGTFIPTVWSSKLLAKFYATTVLSAISNTDYGGEIRNQGDKVIINTIPDITIRNYVAGTNLTYEVPTPNTIEMVIDRGKYFAFQVNDVLAYQAQPNLIDVFSDSAAEQMKVGIDAAVLWEGALGAGNIAAANKGANAGVKSGNFNLGTDTAPVEATPANILQILTAMSAVLDEQNVPRTDRAFVIGPADRQVLLNSNLAQAQFMGDATSVLRNGRVGQIDQGSVYLSNQLPYAVGGASTWTAGDGSNTGVAAGSSTDTRRVILLVQKSWLAFASQITKTETIRNPNDFGDFVRGLQVYGFKAVQPTAAAMAVIH